MDEEEHEKRDMVPDYARPCVQNVVGTMSFGSELELMDIYLRAKNAEYNPNRFAAVIMRLQKPKTTALIFRSGKMVITGAKSQQDCALASRKYAKIIDKILGQEINQKIRKVAIENVVASVDVKFPIDLDEFQYDYQLVEGGGKFNRKQDKVQYEPEVFPGLVYRMHCPKVTFLIFVSGKIVVTGAKS